ncbi:prolyl oligopeptidase family serine peptidase [Teredinibacter turnerae]|uniref:carboxylesterase family protein n=1 Tax=Teredinibacter turnerae TaxID=2426 RepID=UPI0005F768DA|nr:dienelactone hydrolase family protein [Teredinibacter turnerae]
MKLLSGHFAVLAALVGLMLVLGLLLAAYRWYRPAPVPNERQLALMDLMQGKEFVYRGDRGKLTLPYRLFMPERTRTDNTKADSTNADNTKAKALPLILVLHASTGRGNNNFSQLSPAVEQLTSAKLQSLSAAAVIVPQCPKGVEWTDVKPSGPPYGNYAMAGTTVSERFKAVLALIDDVIANYPIDQRRIYITGSSMGASATWQFLYHFPHVFAAAIPMNGRTDPSQAAIIGQTPLWMFHGIRDKVAPIENSRAMQAALEAQGVPSQLTELDAGHGIEYESFTPETYLWLLQQELTTAPRSERENTASGKKYE